MIRLFSLPIPPLQYEPPVLVQRITSLQDPWHLHISVKSLRCLSGAASSAAAVSRLLTDFCVFCCEQGTPAFLLESTVEACSFQPFDFQRRVKSVIREYLQDRLLPPIRGIFCTFHELAADHNSYNL